MSNLHGDRPVHFKKSVPAQDADGQLSVRFFVGSERDGTSMEVSRCLKVADYCKEFGRFVTILVETSRDGPQSTVVGRTKVFSLLMAGQAVQSRSVQEGQLPKRADIER